MSSVWLSNSVTSSTVPETPLGKGKGRDGELYLFIWMESFKKKKKWIHWKATPAKSSYYGKIWQFFKRLNIVTEGPSNSTSRDTPQIITSVQIL